jgi:hypothetical protein
VLDRQYEMEGLTELKVVLTVYHPPKHIDTGVRGVWVFPE